MRDYSAEEAGEALRAMNYRLTNQTTETHNLADYCYNEINNLQSVQAETSTRIAALESEKPFRIFDTDFEFDGVPMKMMIDKKIIEQLEPETSEETENLNENSFLENPNLNDWYADFLKNL